MTSWWRFSRSLKPSGTGKYKGARRKPRPFSCYTGRMKLFDAHCHLQFPQYQDDLSEVLSRMQALEMGAVVIGTDYETSKAGLELAKQHDFLWASVGLHPNDNLDEAFDAAKYEALAQDPKVVAVGECGLDYFRTEDSAENKQKQKKRFEEQIELALMVGKPLVVHCRNAHEDMLEILKDYTGNHKDLRVVMHFFTGSGELAQQYLDLGCYLSFPGPITYTGMYDDSIRACPTDKLLIETDAPFAAPVPFRGKRNEPSYVAEVAKKIAAVKGLAPAEVMEQSAKVASSVFSL
jgi:TatD DNase family protein